MPSESASVCVGFHLRRQRLDRRRRDMIAHQIHRRAFQQNPARLAALVADDLAAFGIARVAAVDPAQAQREAVDPCRRDRCASTRNTG